MPNCGALLDQLALKATEWKRANAAAKVPRASENAVATLSKCEREFIILRDSARIAVRLHGTLDQKKRLVVLQTPRGKRRS
jgi:hypothetical protein